MSDELTICSVYHSTSSAKLLNLNYKLTRSLNPSSTLTWIAVNNAPSDCVETFDAGAFSVIKAQPLTNFVSALPKKFQEAAPMSRHHAHAIHLSLSQVRTRFVLILDNDFFITVPNWIETVIEYIKERNVALLGAPWHPRWWKKVRYFPAHHVLFIDTARIPLRELDFAPQYQSADEAPWRRRYQLSFLNTLHARKLIGQSKDTSYALYQKYKNSGMRVEAFLPVFNFPHEKNFLLRFFKCAVRALVPDRFSYTPKRGTYSETGFKERGFFDARGEGWEEFMWRGNPFGFHMRRTSVQNNRNPAEDIHVLEHGLRNFVSSTN